MADNTQGPLSHLSMIPVLLSKAEKGDFNASKALLENASGLLQAGRPLPADLASWIGLGLKNLSEGGDEKSAFGLRKPRGKPSPYSEEFERLVTDSIRCSKSGLHKGISKDGKKGAYLEASEYFRIAENSAEKFYKKHIDNILLEEKIHQEFANDESSA